jgi:transcription elongation factor Elf1
MEWDARQLEALYANVYRRRRACPACGGALALALSNEPDVLGVFECRACDARHLVAVRNDPLRAGFRPYSGQECRDIFAAERARKTPTCPVDGAEMDVHAQRSLGRTANTRIRCRRCGQVAEYVRPHG